MRAKGEGSIYETAHGYRGAVTVNGKRKYFSAPTKQAAAQKLRDLTKQRDTGELVTGKVPTIGAWLDHWLAITDHRPSTEAGYKYYIEHYIKPGIGKVRLDKLTIDRLESFYATLDGYSGNTRHQVHSIIRVALKHAVWRGHIGRNVAALIKAPTAGKTKTKPLSEADVAAINKTLAGHPHRARWYVSIGLGLRPGEALALEWPDVDGNILHVHQEILAIRGKGTVLQKNTKTEAGTRDIVLPQFIVEAFEETRREQLEQMRTAGEWKTWEPDGEPHAWCFTLPNGHPLWPSKDTEEWKRILISAGVPHERRYVTRHTAASFLIANGVEVTVVAAILGHASPATTLNVYAHAVEERQKAAADVVQRAWGTSTSAAKSAATGKHAG